MQREVIAVPGYQGGLGNRAFSPGIRVGPWLFLSGITAVDYARGKTVGRGEPPGPFTPGTPDPLAQWHQVLGNIKLVIESCGGGMQDVVVANVFVTDMHYYFDYEWIRKEYFVEPYPVCTAVEVNSLVSPDWILEVEIQAYLGGA